MRIEDMITVDESNCCFSKFSPLLLLKTYKGWSFYYHLAEGHLKNFGWFWSHFQKRKHYMGEGPLNTFQESSAKQ